MGTTLGGGVTLEGGSILGGISALRGGSIIGGGVHMGMESTLGGWYGMVSGLVGTGGGVSEAVSGFQSPKRSCSLTMASMWLWCAMARSSLMAHDVNLKAWPMRCGLANIKVPVFQSVTYGIVFRGCINHSVASVVVEGSFYAVAIAAAGVPVPLCVGIVVYDNPEANRTNWGVIVLKRSIEVFSG